MTWDFVKQNTFSVVFPSQKLYLYPDLSIELKLQCFWKTLKLARSALSTSRPFLRRRYLHSFLQRKKCSKMKLHELCIDGKKKCQSFARHWSENGRKSHILYTSDLTDCSKAKSTRSRESRISISRLSKKTSDM